MSAIAPALKLRAWQRFNAKKWYECIVLQQKVLLDLNQLGADDRTEVQHLRYLVGIHPPWLEKKNETTTT